MDLGPVPLLAAFADRFKELRAGRSLQAVSDAIYTQTGVRISPQAMHKWMQGGNITPEKGRVLARFFGVSESWLLHGIGERHGHSLDEFVRSLPAAAGAQVVEFMQFQLERNRAALPNEVREDYERVLDELRQELARRTDGQSH